MTRQPWFPRALPFAVYMLFILIHDGILKLLPPDAAIALHLPALTYPLKIIAVVIALIWGWKHYDELRGSLDSGRSLVLSCLIGLLVFVLWINMDWDWAVMGAQDAYDPGTLPGPVQYPFIAIRILGAAIVVPIFEEIFWRSLILRYIINPDFTKVSIGAYTLPSFIISSLLFGAEHHLWLAGIVAGMLYNFLLYKTRHISYCIFAHGVTNLLLGAYVIQTGQWRFW